MTLPRCELTDLPRIFCGCRLHGDTGFTMTDSERALLAGVTRWGEPPALTGPTPDVRPGRPLGGYTGRAYSHAAHVQPATTGALCRAAGCARLAGDAYLCPSCADDTERILADVPALLEDLEIHAYGQVVFPGSAAGDSVRGISAASHLIHQIHHDLVAAFRALTEERGQSVDLGPDASTQALAAWLLANAAAIPLDPAGPDIFHDLTRWHEAALRAIDAPTERIYIGLCGCGAKLYAPRGELVFTCPTCRTQHDVTARLADIDRRIREATASVAELVTLYRREHKDLKESTVRRRLERLVASRRLMPVNKGTPARYSVGQAFGLLDERPARGMTGS